MPDRPEPFGEADASLPPVFLKKLDFQLRIHGPGLPSVWAIGIAMLPVLFGQRPCPAAEGEPAEMIRHQYACGPNGMDLETLRGCGITLLSHLPGFRDRDAMERYIARAHALGIKLLPYTSPEKAWSVDTPERLGRFMKHHGVNGLLYYKAVDPGLHPEWILIDEQGRPSPRYGSWEQDAAGQWKVNWTVWYAHGQRFERNNDVNLDSWYMCSSAEGYIDAVERGIRAVMDVGFDGVFLDNTYEDRLALCRGPEFGKHKHEPAGHNTDKTYVEVARRVYETVKSYGKDKIVLLNDGTHDVYKPIRDGCMYESYINNLARREGPGHWDTILKLARRHNDEAEHNRFVTALSYLDNSPYPAKDDCFYTYACAQLSGFKWSASSRRLDIVRLLYRARLLVPAGAMQEQGGLWYRYYDRGLVIVNPDRRRETEAETEAEAEVWLPVPASVEVPVDLYTGRRLRVKDGRMLVRVGPGAGRVIVELSEASRDYLAECATTLVRDGQAVATIVLAERPTWAARFAAAELQLHVQKITGALLPIALGDEKASGTRILIGPSAATKQLGLGGDDLKDQEYLVHFLPDAIVLMGKDKAQPAPSPGASAPADASGAAPSVPPPGLFDEQATCYAVYDFLEKCCDVRWYGPGALGLVCPRKRTLTVNPIEVRRRPALLYREASPPNGWGIGRRLWGEPDQREVQLFWRRLRAGGQQYECNHSFDGYYDRYWEKNPQCPQLFEATHPDWFAQGYAGRPPQMCYTNEGFIRQVIQDARDYFDGKGLKPGAKAAGDSFALVPMDNNRYCQCPTCQAQMIPDEASKDHFTRGVASDYIFGFANKVARAIRESHPDKSLATIAYYDYAYYPQKVRLEPNISVQPCLHVRNWWAPAMERNDMKVYRAWVEKERNRPIYLWLYYCFPEEAAANRKGHCFPGFFAHTAARQIKMFARDGIRGAFLNGLGEQVDTYVTFKLFDDPTLDVDRLLDEFFTRYYGAAAGPMKQLYLSIESIYSAPANYSEEVRTANRHFHQTEEMAWKYLGTPERMADLGRLMQQAKAAAATDMEKRRVALFEDAVWKYMVEGKGSR